MTTAMPILETARLRIRPLTLDDLPDVHRTYLDAGWADDTPAELDQRRRWLEWTVRNYVELAELRQPPYGDRAIEVKASGVFVGCVGLVPSFAPFGQLPHYQAIGITHRQTIPEFGLFWALLKTHQGQGYATEAARALIDYAFGTLNLRRIVATTEFDNARSQAVMRRLGMKVERNLYDEPPWLQVVGILEHS